MTLPVTLGRLFSFARTCCLVSRSANVVSSVRQLHVGIVYRPKVALDHQCLPRFNQYRYCSELPKEIQLNERPPESKDRKPNAAQTWYHERLVSVGLVCMLPLAFASPFTYLPDFGLNILIPIHMYQGLHQVVIDYVHNSIMASILRSAVLFLSLVLFYMLADFNMRDVGISGAMLMFVNKCSGLRHEKELKYLEEHIMSED